MRDEDDQLYIYQLYGVSTPRKIKAEKTLRAKIGLGTKITDEQIEHAQEAIDNPSIDFTPYAFEYLAKIEGAIQAMRDTFYGREADYEIIVVPLSNMKGQAGMFGNFLVTEISDMILKFMEKYQRLDDDALDILNNYCKAVRLIYEIQLTESKSNAGQKIVKELDGAINRYNEKFSQRIERS